MTVRHITQADNVDEDGFMIDASLVHHGVIQGGHLHSLGGKVDPQTHLNVDFPDHRTEECAIAETLEVGAPIVRDENDQFARTRPRPNAVQPLGKIDRGARRAEWLEVLRARRSERQSAQG